MKSSGIGLDTIAALFVLVMFGAALAAIILVFEGIFSCSKQKDVMNEKEFQDKKIDVLWNEIKREYLMLYGEDLEETESYSNVVEKCK